MQRWQKELLPSTRTVYQYKWSLFQRWCASQQVDFRHPSVSDICSFLLHLFRDKERCPSNIEDHRTAIAGRLGNGTLDISNNAEITRLIASFHRDRPKSARTIPKWDLNVVLDQLNKEPFEPLHKASLKHLIYKTFFLLALASGKRCSEVNTWTMKGLLCLGDWDQVQ